MSDTPISKQEAELLRQALQGRPDLQRRRFFVSAAAFGAAATSVAGCAHTAPQASAASMPLSPSIPAPAAAAAPAAGGAAPPARVFVKSDARLLNIGATVRSGTYWNYTTFITPVEEFYIRNHYPTPTAANKPELDPKNWKLRIHGKSIARPLEISYEELIR
ncbi:MAG: hypothetical protein N2483_08335, partial [Burkholderiaceae bacterium]|nr:hypothetical protein [Burkholderiaceae bacterium]